MSSLGRFSILYNSPVLIVLNFTSSIFSASQMFVSRCSDMERVRKTDLSGAKAMYGISMSARCVSTVAFETISW